MTAPAPSDEPTRPRGRPRDAAAQVRILRAAVETFSTEGWRGFTLDAVARAAGVGKSTMYLRWNTREELFTDVYTEFVHDWVDPDTGDIREDLRALARAFGRQTETGDGAFGLRFMVESYTNPQFAAFSAGLKRTSISDAHRVVRRAKRRGQLRPDASAAVMLDALYGGLISHITTVDRELAGSVYSTPQGRQFIERLVDMILAGTLTDT